MQAALRCWRRVLGPDHVRTDSATLQQLATATYRTEQRVLAALHPGTAGEVRECLEVATRHGVPLHPVSTGMNWGYGSAVPPRDGCAVLVLSRLDRIADFDEDLAYVTVEPGVTQAALHRFLQDRGSRLVPSATGSSPASSLVGNVLERGLGEGRYGDRFAHVCGLEVALPTGEFLRTGFERCSGARTGPLHRWGAGPHLDGLFTQSRFGVVTRMTLWLAPRAADFQLVTFTADDERLGGLVDAVRGLRLSGVLDGGFVIANDVRAVSSRQQYPRELCGDTTPLPEPTRRALRQRWGVAPWNGEGALHATGPAHGRALRSAVTAALSPHVHDLSFVDGHGRSTLQAGVPLERHLRTAYWRKRTPPPERGLDPDRDGCGLLWVTPVVPLTGPHVREAIATIERTSAEFGLEPNIGLNVVAERTATATTALVYDRADNGADDRARTCHERMTERLVRQGYPPYRHSPHLPAELTPTDDSEPVLDRIRAALDPAGVLAPDRDPRPRETAR